MSLYRALTINRRGDEIVHEQTMLDSDNLPAAELLIEVKYSAFNYFDALLFSGAVPSQSYPHTPGIDAAGIVVQSRSEQFQEGDEVIVTGLGLGITMNGGLGGYISVPADMAIALPVGLTLQTAMTIGTAGIATAIGVMDFLNSGVLPGEHKVAVTGASFDVGAVATAVMAFAGYDVTAYVLDPKDSEDYVKKLGASKVLPIDSLYAAKGKHYVDGPLYDGIFDTMGGDILSSVIKHGNNNSTVVIAGYDKNPELSLTLNPFLDRGINLMGANAIWCSLRVKRKAWQSLASDWRVPQLEWLCTEVSLGELMEYLPLVLDKRAKGRMIINHKA